MDATKEDPSLTPTSKDDLRSCIQKDLSQFFFANNLNALANATDINLVDMPMIDQPSTPDARNYNSLLISPYKPNLFQREEPFLPPGFSPARSVASRGEEPNIFGFGLNSRVFSPFKSELKSRENNCHTNYLRSGFKNCADFQDDENIFEGYPYDPEQDSLSLMFNGGSAIKFKQENELTEESKAGRNLQEDFDNSDLEGNFSSNIDTFPERGSSKILNNLDQFLARKNNSERSLTAFSEIRHTESTQDTRFPNISRPSVPINIFDPRRGSNLFENENSQEYSNNEKGRISRGLRALSTRVKEVVGMLGKTSYKEVADYITEEVARKMKEQGDGEGQKEETNVKRRVYDALNVLIASDILKKDGKTVCCAENTEDIGIFKKNRLSASKERKERRNKEVRMRIEEKQRCLQEKAFQLLAIMNLINRNKEKSELENQKEEECDHDSNDENTQSSSWSMSQVAQSKNNEKITKPIQIPFLVVMGSSEENAMQLHMSKKKEKAVVLSKNQLELFGDVDVLFKLNLHHVSRDLFDEVLPQDVQSRMPSKYLNRLK